MSSSNTKDLQQIIGDCGKFQVFLTLAVYSTVMVSAWGLMFMAFGNYNPGWICLDQVEDNNSTHNYSLPSTVTPLDDEILNSMEWSVDCKVKRECKNLVYNEESSTVVTEWDLSCDMAWVPSFIISIQMTGALVGSYVGGQIGDRYGRKTGLYIQVAFQCICHVLASFSLSWQMYSVVMFFIGFGAAGMLSNSDTFPLEFTNGWWRGFIASIPAWNTSFLIFSAVVFALRNWVHVHIVSAVISALVFLPVFWVPESVRWLTVSGKEEKSKKVIARISRINKRPCPDTSIIDDIAHEHTARMGDYRYSYIDLFKSPVLRSYSIKFGLIWIFLGITYYGISFGIKALSGDFYVNLLISSLVEIPGMLLVAPMVNKLGRRRAALIYFLIQLTCCITLLTISLAASGNIKDMFVFILAMFCKMLVVNVWGVFLIYSAELYPTVIRNIQYGYLLSVSRIGSILSPYLFPNDPDKIYIAFIVLAVIAATKVGLAWSLPETKGKIMRDTTQEEKSEGTSMQNSDIHAC